MWGVTLKTTETLRLRLPDGLRRHHTSHNSLCLIEKKNYKNMGNGTSPKNNWNVGTLERNCSKSTSQFYLKSKYSMKYDITKPSAPQLPTLKNGTKSIQILL